MDKSLKDIIIHLEKLKVDENTLIIFLGDNDSDVLLGATRTIACSAPLKGKKGTHYEWRYESTPHRCLDKPLYQ